MKKILDFAKRKSYAYLFIVLIILSLLLSCLLVKHQNNTHKKESSNSPFQEYTNKLFYEQLSTDSLSLHFYLKHPSEELKNTPATLGDFSYKAIQDSQKYYIENINILKTFDYNNLNLKEKITYDVLLNYFKNQLDYSDLCLCDPILSIPTGIQAQLPILFAEYKFYSQKDIEDYLSLVKQINNYFNQICEFQTLKAKNSSFLSEASCNEIIKQCTSFINEENLTDNIFYTSFYNKIINCNFLSDKEKSDYISLNSKLITSSIFPGYKKIISTLTKLKKSGNCKNNQGICHLKNGVDYYEFLVKSYTGSNKSILELKSEIQTKMLKDVKTMYSILTVSPELENQFYKGAKNNAKPKDLLQDISSKYNKDFPAVDNLSYEIKYVDKNLENYLSPAFYLSPPIDALCENIIYINQSDSYDNQDIYTTLAHEGIPGHMYQEVFFSNTNPLPIRHIMNFGGYTEGWATYVEFLSYSYEYKDSRLAKAMSCNASYSLALYSLCDIGVNYEGWNLKDTKEFLANNNITDNDICKSIYQAVINEPANYLQYYVGFLEICNLKNKVQEKLGANFNLKDFHKAFLSVGPGDFETVEKWIYNFLN